MDGSIVFARWRQSAHMGGHIGATWRIRLNRLSAAAMRSYVKLLWPLVIITFVWWTPGGLSRSRPRSLSSAETAAARHQRQTSNHSAPASTSSPAVNNWVTRSLGHGGDDVIKSPVCHDVVTLTGTLSTLRVARLHTGLTENCRRKKQLQENLEKEFWT